MKPLLRRLISMTGVQLSDTCKAALDVDQRPAGFEFLTDDIFSIEPVVKKTHLSMRSLGRMHMALAKVSIMGFTVYAHCAYDAAADVLLQAQNLAAQ
jgi:hypothetical protein